MAITPFFIKTLVHLTSCSFGCMAVRLWHIGILRDFKQCLPGGSVSVSFQWSCSTWRNLPDCREWQELTNLWVYDFIFRLLCIHRWTKANWGPCRLNFFCKLSKKNVCVCVYIYFLEINSFNVFFYIWRYQVLFSESKLFFNQGHFNNFPFQRGQIPSSVVVYYISCCFASPTPDLLKHSSEIWPCQMFC